jgi:hypothetical protein
MWAAGFGTLEAYRWDGVRLQRESSLGARAGLPMTEARGLIVDSAGLVWMTTTRGLVRVDPQLRSVRVYGVKDGLPSQEFLERPQARPSDGRILVGSPEGLILFDPAVVRPIERAPPLIIETIEVRRRNERIAFPVANAAAAVAALERAPVAFEGIWSDGVPPVTIIDDIARTAIADGIAPITNADGIATCASWRGCCRSTMPRPIVTGSGSAITIPVGSMSAPAANAISRSSRPATTAWK